jgi:hypothetical protein
MDKARSSRHCDSTHARRQGDGSLWRLRLYQWNIRRAKDSRPRSSALRSIRYEHTEEPFRIVADHFREATVEHRDNLAVDSTTQALDRKQRIVPCRPDSSVLIRNLDPLHKVTRSFVRGRVRMKPPVEIVPTGVKDKGLQHARESIGTLNELLEVLKRFARPACRVQRHFIFGLNHNALIFRRKVFPKL